VTQTTKSKMSCETAKCILVLVNSCYKCPPFTHTRLKMPTPLVNCTVNDTPVHATKKIQQALFSFVNVVHLQLLNSLMDNTPYLVVDQMRSGLFGRQWSGQTKEVLPDWEVVHCAVNSVKQHYHHRSLITINCFLFQRIFNKSQKLNL